MAWAERCRRRTIQKNKEKENENIIVAGRTGDVYGQKVGVEFVLVVVDKTRLWTTVVLTIEGM